VDEAVSEAWALLISRLRAAGRTAPVNDSWIAATAIAHRVPVVTQDSDYGGRGRLGRNRQRLPYPRGAMSHAASGGRTVEPVTEEDF
jgi:predicted nucleic acid-binding protein